MSNSANVIPNGTNIQIDQGFGNFSYGVVIAFDATTLNQMGHKGNYSIRLTGGVTATMRPVKIGSVSNVLHSNVSLKS